MFYFTPESKIATMFLKIHIGLDNTNLMEDVFEELVHEMRIKSSAPEVSRGYKNDEFKRGNIGTVCRLTHIVGIKRHFNLSVNFLCWEAVLTICR